METSNAIQSPVIEPAPSGYNNNFLSRFGSPKGFIVFILVVLILGGAVAFTNKQGRNGGGGGGGGNNPSARPTVSEDNPQSLSPRTIVYGNWRDGKSYIKAYDLSTQKEYILGILPMNIKKVTVLSGNKLLYIGNTDEKDHGENISIYDIPSKESNIVYKADDTYGIDDYVISQNKKYISTWEVSLNPASGKLLGGKSRVYAINLSTPGVKNLIYDEESKALTPVHYPRAILSNGEIYLDTFLPNSGAGWAYGMSYSNFDGTIK